VLWTILPSNDVLGQPASACRATARAVNPEMASSLTARVANPLSGANNPGPGAPRHGERVGPVAEPATQCGLPNGQRVQRRRESGRFYAPSGCLSCAARHIAPAITASSSRPDPCCPIRVDDATVGRSQRRPLLRSPESDRPVRPANLATPAPNGDPHGGACPRARQSRDPWDAGRKTKGKKHPILVDTQGLLLHAIVHAADLQDVERCCSRPGSARFRSC
jgi:hypothetical protein